ncbi:hypothetical protein MKJ04_16515 [Pontibacter sp. E15-1]|uniref:hypothetical protein n=1 Tax=Pontibacter sp. E15-1 TaxID=2919918 RepID=UPI001F4F2FD6|nr:hypothetical protein [Pontibacter sp. E15-1]MCJ8166450.1 hypothetical protein [Pontibacter sp. E15-1]
MMSEKQKYTEQLLLIIEIQNRIMTTSQNFDKTTKDAFVNHSMQIKELANNKSTLTQLKSLTSEVLTFWKESIGIDVEYFWTELKSQNIAFERRDELNFALSKGRFRRVDQGMAARKYWDSMKGIKSIINRYTNSEIQRLGEIIEQDEKGRLKILEKCLHRKSIPQTQYLKFGECMAYFGNCRLFNNYFGEDEVKELYEIWKSFKSE